MQVLSFLAIAALAPSALAWSWQYGGHTESHQGSYGCHSYSIPSGSNWSYNSGSGCTLYWYQNNRCGGQQSSYRRSGNYRSGYNYNSYKVDC